MRIRKKNKLMIIKTIIMKIFKELILKKNLKTVGKRALRVVDNLALGGAISKTTDSSEHSPAGTIPILQDPALAIHPPMLYMGYVGFSLVFSLGIASLFKKNDDTIYPWYRSTERIAQTLLIRI